MHAATPRFYFQKLINMKYMSNWPILNVLVC